MTRTMWRQEGGFTLVELLVSTAIMMTVTAGVFTVMNPSGGIFQAQPEVADVQQRLRVGVDTLKHDLVMAGAGAYTGSLAGSLNSFFASVQPSKIGWLASQDDPPETFRSDTITLFYVPSTSAQTTLSASMPATSAELKVNNPPNCPPKDLCGFEEGMQLLLFDDTGAFDPLTVTQVQDNAGHLQRNKQGPLSKSYDPTDNAMVVQVQQHVYYLDTTTNQLMHYDGYQTVAPVIDDVVALDFEYYGEPDPPVLRRPGLDRSTTYGPRPPALGVAQGSWPAGENCTFRVIAGQQQPRLPALGAPGGGLVRLTAATLTDGPWCPAADNPNRFDADLFRVRTVRVSLRVQATNPDFRRSLGSGADAMFLKPGTSRGGYRQVPDQAIRFDVSPRNLNLSR
jgi:Prokaryotic N-terminal methylation motif